MAVLSGAMSVFELTPFQALVMPGEADPDLLARRFMTLVTDPVSDGLRGGSGHVIKVTNCYGESFAMKTTLKVTSLDLQERMRVQSARQRAFMEEYRAHSSVTGIAGIPQLFGSGKYERVPAVLMEWIDGYTVSSVAHLFPPARGGRGHPGQLVAAVGLAVARILLEAQGRAPGFVHRDISVGNIMLRGSAADITRQVSLLDFDVCLIDMGSSLIPAVGSASITMGADIWRFGTPEYAPPEMLTRDVEGVDRLRSSPSVDVYALCSVLYELYAGYPPYDMEHNQSKLGLSPYIMKRQYAPINLRLHDARDRELGRMIMAGIVPEQQNRIPLERLYDGLQAYLGRRDLASSVVRRAGAMLPPLVSCDMSLRSRAAGGCGVCDALPAALTNAMVDGGHHRRR